MEINIIKNIKKINWLFAFFATLVLTGCFENNIKIIQIPIQKFGSSKSNNVDSNLSFAGISSIDLKTDSTLRINWSANLDAVSYDIYDTTSSFLVLLHEVDGLASNSFTLSKLNPGATYKFRVRMKTASGEFDDNINDVSVTMDAAPSIPSALTMEVPEASPGFNSTPTIKVRGVKSGDVITLYTDSSCTPAKVVATKTASGSTVNLTTSALTAGAINFYAKATNPLIPAASSACSTATVLYTLASCPDGFVEVPGSNLLRVKAFCVMQFEARRISFDPLVPASGTPSSKDSDANGVLWRGINQINAKIACLKLDPSYIYETEIDPLNPKNPSHYDLISNPEWLTIAHNVESTPSNWSNNAVRSGKLPRGHSDNTPSNYLTITNLTDPYNGKPEDPIPGWEQKRTYTLDNGSVVWDLAGNLWEWVDWKTDPGLDRSPSCETDTPLNPGDIKELKDVSILEDEDCHKIPTIDYLPLDWTLTTATNGIGGLSGGSGGGGFRGGKKDSGIEAGLFTLDLFVGPGDDRSAPQYGNDVGFRCVYRP